MFITAIQSHHQKLKVEILVYKAVEAAQAIDVIKPSRVNVNKVPRKDSRLSRRDVSSISPISIDGFQNDDLVTDAQIEIPVSFGDEIVQSGSLFLVRHVAGGRKRRRQGGRRRSGRGRGRGRDRGRGRGGSDRG